MSAHTTRRLLTLAALALLLTPPAGTLASDEAPAYEDPPALLASDVLEGALRKGANHEVREQVRMRRFLHAYVMESPYGVYEVTSHRLLETRVHEVETIARVVGMEGAPQGLKALGQSLGRLPGAAVEIVLHPIESAEKLGKGLEKTWGRIEDLFRRRRHSVYEDSAAGNAFAGDEKRKLAAELHLDVYSTNPRVQEFLNEIANWRAAGNLTLDVASFALPFVGYMAVTATKWRADVHRLLRDKTPAELDRHNAAVLLGLGIPRDEVGRFLHNPWLSPRHDSVITGALGQMKGVANLGAAIQAATTARDEVGALYHEQQVELLSHYHAKVQPLASLQQVGHVVAARTKAGNLVVMMPADQVYWMQDFDRLTQALRALDGESPAAPVRLHVTGRVTARARAALEAGGFELTTGYRPLP